MGNLTVRTHPPGAVVRLALLRVLSFLGAACVGGAAAGFVWLSADWPQPEPGDWGLFEQFVRLGEVWLPLVVVGIAALLLLVWWAHPGEPEDGEPRDTADRPDESGHVATAL